MGKNNCYRERPCSCRVSNNSLRVPFDINSEPKTRDKGRKRILLNKTSFQEILDRQVCWKNAFSDVFSLAS